MELKNNMIMKNETKIYIDDVLHYLDVENAKLLNCLRTEIKIGQRYRQAEYGHEYLLATPSNLRVMLINTITGTRWNDGAAINDYDNITKEEFQKITNSGEFILVK